MKSYLVILYYVIFFLNFKDSFCIDTLVQTSHGLVLGLTATDGNYTEFLGIPYAKVDPNNPFGAPIERDHSASVHYAFDDSVVCPQEEDFTIIGSLDCLHVNFYVPHSATSQNLLPVMVWIHGGSFKNGNSNRVAYGPKFIVKHDVILVTLNYRVGPYGFMCLNTPEIPGNAGLKDQLAALRWIRQNVVAFGGDPNRITLFGESAGATSVEFQMVSGHVNGLIDRVILQSNSILGLRGPVSDDPILHARQLGFNTTDVGEAIEFLKIQDPHRLIQATVDLNSSFMPCIEEQFDGVEAFIKDKPSTSLTTGPYHNVSVLSGFNNMESLYNLYFYGNYNPSVTTDVIIAYHLNIYFDFNDEELAAACSYAEQFYIGGSNKISDNAYELVNFESDIRYIYHIYRGGSVHIGKRNNVAYYEYIFSYSGERNYLKNSLNITADGACHADELGYLFDQNYVTSPITADDQIIIDRMTTMWTNFAKYNDPTPQTNDLIPVKWDPSQIDNRRYLVIDKELHMSHHPYHDRMAFWNVFFDLYKDNIKY